jgi:hypothetical protein
MIESAWDEYRGWARRARDLQEASGEWNRAALACATLAALLGAIASQAENGAAWGKVASFLAAAAAAVTPVLGRDMLAVGREAGWIRARATAEAIKSECFRFAAQLGDYGAANAVEVFVKRRELLTGPAMMVGLTPLPDPVLGTLDDRRPPRPLTSDWYREHRLQEQLGFYARGQARNETLVARLRAWGLAAAIGASVLGVAGSFFGSSRLAPWIGVVTTLGTSIVAYGLLDRRQYLAASYGAMVMGLGRIRERFIGDNANLAELVGTTEDLLQGEHAAWTERMTKTITVAIPDSNKPLRAPEPKPT